MSDPTGLVQKLWSYCNVLRGDWLSHGDYLERCSSGSAPSGRDARAGTPVRAWLLGT